MKPTKLWIAFGLAAIASSFVCARAQGIVPKLTPTPYDDVVKITTNLIQVDVTVTDKNDKLITDLKQNEIEIYENGEKQEITMVSTRTT